MSAMLLLGGSLPELQSLLQSEPDAPFRSPCVFKPALSKMHDSDGPLYLALIRLAVQLSLYRASLSSLRYSSLLLLWILVLMFFFF